MFSAKWLLGRQQNEAGHGQIMLADELILVMAEDGDVALVEAIPEAFRELGRFEALDDRPGTIRY